MPKASTPLDKARAVLESALPLMTRDPASPIDDLVRSSPERQELEGLSDGDLLRKAARELAMAIYVVAHLMLRQEAEALVITRTGAVAVLVRGTRGRDPVHQRSFRSGLWEGLIHLCCPS